MDYDQNHYAMLGVSRHAGDDDIKNIYRAAAHRFHPDVNKTPGALALFKNLNTAYEALSDNRKRHDYNHVYDAQFSGPPALKLETYYSRQKLRRFDGPQLLYVLVKIIPLLEMTITSDAPLNLSLVIDRSKSMHGARMDKVKAAARRIVDSCDKDDVLSVITFSDHAEVVVPAQRIDEPRSIQALINTIRADGSTALLGGLQKAVSEIDRHLDSTYVNHIILITDGRTYGDEPECLALARRAHTRGIGISGMGIGEDWNDSFLDDLVSATGGSSGYVSRPDMVESFLQTRIRSLATAYAERARTIVAPSLGVDLDNVTRVSPDPMEMHTQEQPMPLGTIDGITVTSLMLQFRVNTGSATEDSFYIGRMDVAGDVLGAGHGSERVFEDLSVSLTDDEVTDDPPPELVDALSSLTLYRLQNKARTAAATGNIREATQQLEYLATRLFEGGQKELGEAALQEARRVSFTNMLSEEGAKQLKYGTRALMHPDVEDENND